MQIKSTSDFLAKCLANPLLQKDGTTVFYRGINIIPPKDTRHIPSLYFLPGRFYETEHKILKEVISVFPEEMLAQKSTVEKLFIMRHYGFPTRLLDISKNPLVDLFFACFTDKGQDDTKDKDGVVYIYAVKDNNIKFSESDKVAILANISKIPSKKFDKDYTDAVDKLCFEIEQERIGFHRELLEDKSLNKVLCVRPRMNNPRIIRQSSYFFLFGIDGEKKNCAKMPPEWIQDEIIIPARYKSAILQELDGMDYNESFFYPDFEHLNNVIRKRYGNLCPA